jgi:hypothetical protein
MGKTMASKKIILVGIISSLPFTTTNLSAQPTLPQLTPPNFKAQLERAAYALFLAEACSIPTQIQSQAKKIISLSDENESRQSKLLTEIRQIKSRHADDSNPISIAKRCHLESAKTRSFISDVGSELEETLESIEKKRSKYAKALENWNRDQEKERERSERERQEKKRAAIDRDANQLGRLVVSNKYDGGANVSITLKDWYYSESDKTATAKVEIRWQGKFTGKSYGADGAIRMVYDESQNWELGKNYFWNPSWISPSLEAYIRCTKTLFGTCD